MSNPFYRSTLWKKKRTRILKRDKYCCRECRRYGRNRDATTVHHVNPLMDSWELRLIDWNLLSLCGVCHNAMHDRVTDTLTPLGEYWRDKLSRGNE